MSEPASSRSSSTETSSNNTWRMYKKQNPTRSTLDLRRSKHGPVAQTMLASKVGYERQGIFNDLADLQRPANLFNALPMHRWLVTLISFLKPPPIILVWLASSSYRVRSFISSFEAAMCYLPRAELRDPCPGLVGRLCVDIPREPSLLLSWLSWWMKMPNVLERVGISSLPHSDNKVEVVGLQGLWKSGEDETRLCHFEGGDICLPKIWLQDLSWWIDVQLLCGKV